MEDRVKTDSQNADAQDADDLRKAQDALAASDARFRVLADSMPQMVWSTRPDGFHD